MQARPAVIHQEGPTDSGRGAVDGVAVLIAVVRMVALDRLAVIVLLVTHRSVMVPVVVVVTVLVVVAMLDVAVQRRTRVAMLIGAALMRVDHDGGLTADQARQRQQRDQQGRQPRAHRED